MIGITDTHVAGVSPPTCGNRVIPATLVRIGKGLLPVNEVNPVTLKLRGLIPG
jgi:hypothetical protein